MANTTPIVNTFNGGEMSPLVMGRVDQARFFSSLETCLNWIPLTAGSVRVRGGFKYAGACKNADKECYLLPFVYSASVSYMLEFGPLYIRIWKYNATTGEPEQVTSTGTPVEVVTTYTEAELDEVQVKQSGAVLFLAHPSHAPAKLTCTSETVWTLSTITWTIPPTYEPNTDLNATLSAVCAIGAVVFTGSGLNDAASGGTSTLSPGGSGATYTVVVEHAAATDKVKWRKDAGSWTEDVSMTGSAQALADGVTITFSATTGHTEGEQWVIPVSGTVGVTFTAGASVFLAGDAGRHITAGSNEAVLTSYTSATAVVGNIIAGTFPLSGAALAAGAWTLDGSPTSVCYLSAAGPVGALVTVDLHATVGGADQNGFRATDVNRYLQILGGTLKISSFTSAQAVQATVLAYCGDWTATIPYALGGAWSIEDATWAAARGYPSALTIGQQRVWYAGAAAESDTVRGTTTGDYYSFTVGAEADDSVEYVIGSEEVNLVKWLAWDGGLICGAVGAEITLRGANKAPLGGDVLPDVDTPSTYGSDGPRPDKVPGALLFVQSGGRSVIAWGYDLASDKFTGSDLMEWASHLTETYPLKRSTYQRTASGQAKGLVWYVRSDGVLCCLTWNPKQQVTAWSRHTLGGTSAVVLGAAVIRNPVLNRDDLWVTVSRTVGGATKRYIEVLDFSRYLDCSYKYSGVATATVTGLSHLNGDSVWIRGKASTDGLWRLYPAQTVTGNQVTGLSPTVTEAEVGYYSTATAKLPPVELAGAATIQGRHKGWGQATVRCYDTPVLNIGGVKYKAGGAVAGYSAASVYPIPTGTNAIAASGAWGDVEVSGLKSYDRTGQITFTQDLPVGGTLLLFTGTLDVGD